MKKFLTIILIIVSIVLLIFGLIPFFSDLSDRLEYEELVRRSDAIEANELQPKINEITKAFKDHKEVFIAFRDAFREDPNMILNVYVDGTVVLDSDDSKNLTIEDLSTEQQNAFHELQNIISFEAISCLPYEIEFYYYRGKDPNPPWPWANLKYNEQFTVKNSPYEVIYLEDYWFIDSGVGWGV